MFFRDFETFTQEVPECEGLRSYSKIPFSLMRFDQTQLYKL